MCAMTDHLTAPELAARIGRQRIAATFDVSLAAVSKHCVQGWFPASWFLGMKALADEVSSPCPDSLFSFVTPPTPLPAARTVRPA